MLNHELPFRLRVPLHSPILSYRTAKAPDIRGFAVSDVLYCPALSKFIQKHRPLIFHAPLP